MTVTGQRARSAEAKAVRIEAFLNAAREVAAREGVRRVTLTAVTKQVGLHPSALRRYFESTEELLLQLAEQGWAEWRDSLVPGLATAEPREARSAAEIVSASLEQLPVFCDLLVHVALSLEGEVRIDRARQYKLSATSAYDEMVEALADAVDGLDQAGARLVMTAAMTSGAYQYQLSRPTPSLRQLYAEEPRWEHSALRFREQLTELLTAVIRGVQASQA